MKYITLIIIIGTVIGLFSHLSNLETKEILEVTCYNAEQYPVFSKRVKSFTIEAKPRGKTDIVACVIVQL